MKWPQIPHPDQLRLHLIPSYNRMTKLRVELRNKLVLNNFDHAELLLSGADLSLSTTDLELFFDIDNISIKYPTQEARSFKLKLKQNHPIGQVDSIHFYEYKNVCIRCSPETATGNHLCPKCLAYLNSNFDKLLPLNG